MNILYHCQPSMRDYRDNAWLLNSDSQFTKMGHWVRALPHDWTWTWIIPRDTRAVPNPPFNVRYRTADWAPNVLLDRYAFPMRDVLAVLNDEEFDVAFVETIEHAAAYRKLQDWTGRRFPLIGMIGLYDNRDDGFYHRQLEGFLACDEVIFPLESVQRDWLDRVMSLLDPQPGGSANRLAGRSWDVVPAIYSPKEVLQATPKRAFETVKLGDPRSVLFISRLSDNARTRFTGFFEECRALHSEGIRFQVHVANPNGAMSSMAIRELCPMVGKVGPWSRKEYLAALWSADIVPVLYPLENGYSVGVLEAITACCTVVKSIREGLEMDGEERKRFMAEQRHWAVGRSVEAHVDKIVRIVESVT